MFNIGPMELIVVLVIALMVFGPKKLPEIGRTVGKSLREFRAASAQIRQEVRSGMDGSAGPADGERGAETGSSGPASEGTTNPDSASSGATSA